MPEVYEKDSEEREFVEKGIKAGVPFGQLELIMALSKLLDKKPLDVQNIWLDQHVGIQQVARSL